MLYVPVAEDEPVRQGDIFIGVPKIEADFANLPSLVDGEMVQADWSSLHEGNATVQAVVSVQPVTAIVITQDCDAIRAPDITLCQVLPFAQVEALAKDATSPKRLAKILTRQARLNLKWFHLPQDEAFGIQERSAVDFRLTFSVPRESLEPMVPWARVSRLNEYAYDHFRERLGHFFRRYPYDEWYTLLPTELAEYQKDYADAEAFPWQQPED